MDIGDFEQRVWIPAFAGMPEREICPRSSMDRTEGFYPSDVGSIPTGGVTITISPVPTGDIVMVMV